VGPPKFSLCLHEDAEVLVSKKGEELITGPGQRVTFEKNALGLVQEGLVKPELNHQIICTYNLLCSCETCMKT